MTPGPGACLGLAYVALLLLGAAGTYAEMWRTLP